MTQEMGADGKSSTLSPRYPRRLNATMRRERAVELRCSGLTFEAIGAELGIRRQSVQKLLDQALAQAARRIAEHADELRALESQRLDQAALSIWPRVQQGDARAQDTWLRNRQRYAALLGLDLKPPDVTVDASQNVIVLPAWGEQPAQVDGEARALPAETPDAG